MTGWRIGYAAGPRDLIKAMAKVQSQSTTNPTSISQAVAVEALNGTQHFIAPLAETFKQRRDLVVRLLYATEGIIFHNHEGALYVQPATASGQDSMLPHV